MTTLLTIVELPEFQKRARSIMSGEEREHIVLFLAANPEAGLSLGGGLRKVRVPRSGGGKSGGFRVVYVFGGMHMPLFLVTVFGKNEKSNLTTSEQSQAVKLAKQIVAHYGETQ